MKIKVKLPNYVCRNGGLTEHEYYLLEVRNRRIEKFFYDGWREGGYYSVESTIGGIIDILFAITQSERVALMRSLENNTDHDTEYILREFTRKQVEREEAKKQAIRNEIHKLNNQLKNL